MKDFKRSDTYLFTLETTAPVCLVIEHTHIFGDYEAAKDGQLVISTLKLFGNKLFHLAGDEEFDVATLVNSALKYAHSADAQAIVEEYEKYETIYKSNFPNGLYSINNDDQEFYFELTNKLDELANDYFATTYCQTFGSFLRAFLEQYSGGAVRKVTNEVREEFEDKKNITSPKTME